MMGVVRHWNKLLKKAGNAPSLGVLKTSGFEQHGLVESYLPTAVGLEQGDV